MWLFIASISVSGTYTIADGLILDVWDIIALGAVLFFALFSIQRLFFKRPIAVAMKRQEIGKRDFTREQLREFDGTDPMKPILLGVKGKVYDVSARESFYGPGGSYHCFAGRDASRALGKSSTEDSEANNPSISDLTPEELNTLNEWATHYETRYRYVGNIID